MFARTLLLLPLAAGPAFAEPPGLLHRLPAAGACVFAFTPDGSAVVVADATGRIELWDAHSGKSLKVLREKGEAVRAAAFAPDGSALAVGEADAIRLLDA